MPVDEAMLAAARLLTDEAAGYREEFLSVELAGARTTAILATPLGPARDAGWVICHSFGMEQVHLARLDAGIARALAARGFPVLRYHGHGHGDSAAGMRTAGLSVHVEEAVEACALLRERTGVGPVGTIGARYGGLVAALAADRLDLPSMALVEPVVRGGSFMRDFLRSQVLADIVATSKVDGEANGRDVPAPPSAVARMRHELETNGWTDVKGFLLSAQAHREISSADLSKDLERFGGTCVLLGLSRTGAMSAAGTALAGRLEQLGARCERDVMQDRLAASFGQHHHRNDAGARKTDLAFDLYRGITERLVRAIERAAGGSGEDPAAGRREEAPA